MPPTRDPQGTLRLDGLDLAGLVQEVGTPAYVYDLDAIAAEARALHQGFEGAAHLVAYALKANSAGAVVRTLAREGCGADVVSGAELSLALACGVAPENIVYSGVAKQDGELDRAIASGIGAVQIESVEEIARVERRARALGRTARVSIRVNPGVDLASVTHAHVATGHDAAKFGIKREDVPAAVRLAEDASSLELVGMATHVGSQFASVDPYVQGARAVFDLVRGLRAAGRLRSMGFVDTGGGFGVPHARAKRESGRNEGVPHARAKRESGRNEGVPHARAKRESGRNEDVPRPADFVRATRAEQRAYGLEGLSLYVEPGRALVAPHGILLARVVQPKVTATGRWLMIDAGMNDLVRPALYQARHRIVPLNAVTGATEWVAWRVAGPVCESSDDFGDHALPGEPPSAVAILDAGAYGYTMASRYNGRQLPAEVFVSGGRVVGRTQRASVESWVEERAKAGG
jgi:diaminopimelate decarboxylase